MLFSYAQYRLHNLLVDIGLCVFKSLSALRLHSLFLEELGFKKKKYASFCQLPSQPVSRTWTFSVFHVSLCAHRLLHSLLVELGLLVLFMSLSAHCLGVSGLMSGCLSISFCLCALAGVSDISVISIKTPLAYIKQEKKT